jgi:hypothetical protein
LRWYLGEEVGRRKEKVGRRGDPQEHEVAPHPVLGRALAKGGHGVNVRRHFVDVGPVEAGPEPQRRVLVELGMGPAHAESGHARIVGIHASQHVLPHDVLVPLGRLRMEEVVPCTWKANVRRVSGREDR